MNAPFDLRLPRHHPDERRGEKFPEEFKRDVVRVARRGDLSQAEFAADFDISVESVRRWVRQADIDDGVFAGQTSSEQNELAESLGVV